jgi:alpha-1,3-mannosyltransferase
VGLNRNITLTDLEINSTLLELAPKYVKAIMSPEDITFPRLKCPAVNEGRYEYMRTNAPETWGSMGKPRYFFALDLHDCVDKLPRLLGSVVETINFLGVDNCVLSIVEGRSHDATFEVLDSLRAEMDAIGVQYHLRSSDLDPKASDRVKGLAELRNLALEPMMSRPAEYSKDSTIIFLNDVSICMEDILELIHQRTYQGADMTCAMDWTYVGQDPTFYDVWIARGMNGDSFFEIPSDGNWNSAWNIFWNNPTALDHYRSHKSFQVFSCWNGATAFTAKPFLERRIEFRRSISNECPSQGEPQLFCKDLWHIGYRKIAVVPSVNLEYSDDAARKIKDAKGYTSQWAEGDSDIITWDDNPPATVKCMQGYANQVFVPWNEGL